MERVLQALISLSPIKNSIFKLNFLNYTVFYVLAIQYYHFEAGRSLVQEPSFSKLKMRCPAQFCIGWKLFNVYRVMFNLPKNKSGSVCKQWFYNVFSLSYYQAIWCPGAQLLSYCGEAYISVPGASHAKPSHKVGRFFYQCCGSGMFLPDHGSEFFHPGSMFKKIPDPYPHQRILKYFKAKKLFLSPWKNDLGCSSLIPCPDLFPIPDPEVKKVPDPQHCFLLILLPYSVFFCPSWIIFWFSFSL